MALLRTRVLTRSTVALVAVLMLGCGTMRQPVFHTDRPHLKIVTYNINWGMARRERVLDYLAECDADIVLLQETTDRWEKALRRRIGSAYPHTVFKNAPGAGGIAIMSRYRLRKRQTLYPQAGWFPALLCEADTPIGQIQLLNVHLRPPLSDSGSATPSAIYKAPEIHKKELKEYLARTDARRPLIIAGDFNESENRAAVEGLLSNGFCDALSLFDNQSHTWEWELSMGVKLKNRYDHILFDKRMQCIGAKVTEVSASDHMPVFAVFTAGEE